MLVAENKNQKSDREGFLDYWWSIESGVSSRWYYFLSRYFASTMFSKYCKA